MANDTYLIRPAAATGGEQRVPLKNLLSIAKADRTYPIQAVKHSPYASAANSWNINTITTDASKGTEYLIQFKHADSANTLEWKFANSTDRDDVLANMDASLGTQPTT